jgi:hypothetical protein
VSGTVTGKMGPAGKDLTRPPGRGREAFPSKRKDVDSRCLYALKGKEIPGELSPTLGPGTKFSGTSRKGESNLTRGSFRGIATSNAGGRGNTGKVMSVQAPRPHREWVTRTAHYFPAW